MPGLLKTHVFRLGATLAISYGMLVRNETVESRPSRDETGEAMKIYHDILRQYEFAVENRRDHLLIERLDSQRRAAAEKFMRLAGR